MEAWLIDVRPAINEVHRLTKALRAWADHARRPCLPPGWNKVRWRYNSVGTGRASAQHQRTIDRHFAAIGDKARRAFGNGAWFGAQRAGRGLVADTQDHAPITDVAITRGDAHRTRCRIIAIDSLTFTVNYHAHLQTPCAC